MNSLINISPKTLNLLAQNKSLLLEDRVRFQKELENRGEGLKFTVKKNQNIKFNKELFSGYSLFLILVPILYFNYVSAKTLVNQGEKAQNQFYSISITLWVIILCSVLLFN